MEAKKKLNKIDRYLIFSIAALCVYTVIEQLLTIRLGFERSTLTTCFYGAFGGEILACCVIKVFNIKNEDKEQAQSLISGNITAPYSGTVVVPYSNTFGGIVNCTSTESEGGGEG